MGKINVLSKHVAELIAAGEVVERPSSVVKELLENSVDSGAASITIEIENGGVTYIRITDNGCGIERDDIKKAFIRHATSKIKEEIDLDAIATLGFRGEALASIAAVANVEMLTRTSGEEIGHRIIMSGGEEKIFEEAGCPIGTTIIVRDLFFNVPARMKFLKKDVAEGNAVAGVVDKLALSHPEISFTFIRSSKQVLKTAGDGNLKSTIYSVYGAEFARGLVPVDYCYDGIQVTGFVSRPENARASRAMQNFFLNGRYVKSKTAMAALDEAGKGTLMVGKHFAAFLNIEMPLELVDVNVHPAKIEVRFINERPVFSAVYHGVKTALSNSYSEKTAVLKKENKQNPFAVFEQFDKIKNKPDTVDITPQEKTSKQELFRGNTVRPYSSSPQPPLTLPEQEKPFLVSDKTSDDEAELFVPGSTVYDSKKQISFDKMFASPERSKTSLEESAEEKAKLPEKKTDSDSERSIPESDGFTESGLLGLAPSSDLSFVGEAFNTYIIMEKPPGSLIMIDKHAAHERLIYERLKKEKGKGFAQYLLRPEKIVLSKEEYNVLLENKTLIFDSGFEIDDFGEGSVVVRSIPSYLDENRIQETIVEIAGHLLSNKQDITTEHIDWIYHNISCRSAIKGGDFNSSMELKALVDELILNPDVRYCPHGRPIFVSISKKEIEKLFGRV